MLGDDVLAQALETDYRSAALGAQVRLLLDYAVKLTRHPETLVPSDVEQLRAAGWTDSAILDACQVTAYYNYVNRLAQGLGVELEPFWSSLHGLP